jgi:hypothetical protein
MGGLANLYGTYPGMYVVQTVVHSAVAAAVAELAVLAWRVRDPAVKQRLHFMVIVLPMFSFPLYQALDPERGSTYFRLDSMLDTGRWLTLKVMGPVTLGPLVALALSATALVFVLQEFVPVARHMLDPRRPGAGPGEAPHDPALEAALGAIPGEKPTVAVLDDDGLVLFSSTGREPGIFVSRGVLRDFSADQLEVALAHEVAHIRRSRKPVLVLLFVLRVLMFYNPVALVEFRKAVLEEEKICDNEAASMTGKPGALAEVLGKFRAGGEGRGSRAARLSDMTDALEEYSHDMLLKSRIGRLEHGGVYNTGGGWLQTAAAVAVAAVLNYYIV